MQYAWADTKLKIPHIKYQPFQPKPLGLDSINTRFSHWMIDIPTAVVSNEHVRQTKPQKHGKVKKPLGLLKPTHSYSNNAINQHDHSNKHKGNGRSMLFPHKVHLWSFWWIVPLHQNSMVWPSLAISLKAFVLESRLRATNRSFAVTQVWHLQIVQLYQSKKKHGWVTSNDCRIPDAVANPTAFEVSEPSEVMGNMEVIVRVYRNQ